MLISFKFSRASYVKQILRLITPLGVKTKGQIDVEEYKEEYIPYVNAIEEHFGMTVDGYCYKNQITQLSVRGIVRYATSDLRNEKSVGEQQIMTFFYYKHAKKVPSIDVESFDWWVK